MRWATLVTAFLCPLAMAQEPLTVLDDPAVQTIGSPNGGAWKLLSEPEKLAFLAGYRGAPCTGDDDPRLLLTTGRKKVDRFYADPENLVIPINAALVLLSGQAYNPTYDKDVANSRMFYKHLAGQRLKSGRVKSQ